MGIGRFFKSLTDNRVCGQETVATQERMYEQVRRQAPGKDPHFYLAQVYASRARLHGVSEQTLQITAFSETFQFACVPAPACARALGLYFVYKERPDIVRAYPEFAAEFGQLIGPVHEAIEKGKGQALYARLNPRMAAEATS